MATASDASITSAAAGAPLPAPAPRLPRMRGPGEAYSSVAAVSFAEDMNPRYRSTMEDTHSVVDEFGDDAGSGYFGIYDGHGGRNVAEYLRLHLHNSVERELTDKGERSVEECLKTAFLTTDIECGDTGEQASGSTAIVCIVRRQGAKRYVYTANVGDARAVLCHAGVAVRLSKDHKATDSVERTRVEAAGGFVIRKRVMGVLAVARSFGDFVLKKYVSAEPYTSTTKLDAMSQFIILACDGIWDVMEDQEAVDLIRDHLSGGGGGATLSSGGAAVVGGGATAAAGSGAAETIAAPSADVLAARIASASQVLIDASLARGTSDNVTALVAFL